METNKSEDMRFKGKNTSLAGIVLILIGVVFLLRNTDIGLPEWIFTWPMIPIAIGLYIGAKNSFRAGGWMVPTIVGLVFLINHSLLDWEIRDFFWPVVLISLGIWMIVRPRKKFDTGITNEMDDEDAINSSVIFGGIKKNVLSKNFKGGRIENLFSGTDVNLMQADVQGGAVLDINVAFGGVKLLVPAHWEVRNSMTAIMGGVEDKRPIATPDNSKVLTLTGSVLAGGVEIKSY